MIEQLIQEITEERYALLTKVGCGAITSLAFAVCRMWYVVASNRTRERNKVNREPTLADEAKSNDNSDNSLTIPQKIS